MPIMIFYIVLLACVQLMLTESLNKTNNNALINEQVYTWNTFLDTVTKQLSSHDNVTVHPRITSLVNLSLLECVIECQHRQRCVSVTYKERFKLCSLNRDGTVERPNELIQGAVFLAKKEWNKVILESFAVETFVSCGINEQYLMDTDGSKCIPSDCGLPPNITNGKHDVDVEIGIHSQVKYQCNEGLYADGIPHIGCQSNGDWSPIRLICTLVDCGPPPTLDYMTVSYENSTYGSKASYICVDCNEFLIEEDKERLSKCEINGQWSNIETCEPDWTCKTPSDALEMVIIADDTCSIDDQEFRDQIGFFQNIVASLHSVSNCSRVRFYTHSDNLHMVLDSVDFSNSNRSFCSTMNTFKRECKRVKEEKVLEAANKAIETFSKKGILFVISDMWPPSGTNLYESVSHKALDRTVHVVYIVIGKTIEISGINVHKVDITSSSELVTKALQECFSIMIDIEKTKA